MPVNLVSKDVPKSVDLFREQSYVKTRRTWRRTLCSNMDLILQLKRCSHRKKVVLLVVGEPETIIVYFFVLERRGSKKYKVKHETSYSIFSTRIQNGDASGTWNLIIFSASLLHLGSTQDINNCTYRHRKM